MPGNKVPTLDMTVTQLQEAVRRLCHFVPIGPHKDLPIKLRTFLVQHAMADPETGPHSVVEIQESLRRLFGLDFEPQEVRSSLEKMIGDDFAFQQPGVEQKYSLSIDKKEELSKVVEDSKKFEKWIFEDWLKVVSDKYPTLGKQDLQVLEEDLRIFANNVFLRHGAECAALVYSGKKEAEQTDALLARGGLLINLPPRNPTLVKIRETEFSAFFTEAPEKRKKYIAELLDCTFILHILSIDETASALIQRQLKGRLLYLDTNFIYRLLDLQGQDLCVAALQLLEISQKLGFITAVSTRTVKELQTSLRTADEQLRATSLLSRELARVGAAYTLGQGFVGAYWRKYGEKGVSLDDFVATYQHMEDLLAEHNVEVRDELCKEVEDDPQLDDEKSKLHTVCDDLGLYFLPLAVIEHDAFHRLLIKKLRAREPRTFGETKVWFLTCDTKLPKYARFARTSRNEIPFCILLGQWLQLVRPLLPRTQDFDATFTTLLSSPYLRSYPPLPVEIAQIILGRIAQFKRYSPEFAGKVLADEALVRRIQETDDEAKQLEMIDNAAVAAAEGYKKERDEAKAQVERLTGLVEDRDKKLHEHEKLLEKESERRERFEEAFKKSVQSLTKELNDVKENLSKEQAARLRFERWFKMMPAVLWVIAVLACVYFIPWTELSPLVTSIITCILLASLGLVLMIPLGRYKIWKIVGVVAAILGIFGFIMSLVFYIFKR